MKDLIAEFLQKYADLPFGARDEIIAIIGEDTFTWRSAKVEVDANTKIGKQILKQMDELDIL